MSLHPRTLPAGFIAPCLPSSAPQTPSGEVWLHEIKHDGFRLIARKDDARVKLYSRPGNDLTDRFPLIVQALAKLRSRSCIIDGEAVACGDDGISSFDRIRYRRHDASVFLYAFDLIELAGHDLRREPLAVRKATLASLVARVAPGLRTRTMARWYLRRLASSDSRALCRNGATRHIARDARRIGSRARTPLRLPCSGRPKRIGVGHNAKSPSQGLGLTNASTHARPVGWGS
jgi:hypothetical protein